MIIRSKLLWIILCLTLVGAFAPTAAYGLDGSKEPITAANAHRLKLLTTWGMGRFNNLAWSPDRKTLAAGTQAGLWLFNAALPRAKPRLLVTDAVSSLAFSADGSQLAAATDQGVQLWDTAQWQASGERFGGAFWGIALSPDGKMLAGSFNDGVQLWDITSRQLIAQPASKGSYAVAFSPDGTRLAYGGPIQIWDIQKQAAVMELKDKTDAFGGARSLAFSPDGTRLAAANEERISIWDTQTGSQVDLLSTLPNGAAPCVEYDRKGTLLLTKVTSDNLSDTIQLRNVLSNTALTTFQVGTDGLYGDLSFSPDGALLASLRNILGVGVAHWWDVKTGSSVYQVATDNVDMYWLPKNSTGLFLVPGGLVRPRLWRVTKGREQLIVDANTASLGTFDPVHNRLALSYADSPMRVLDAQTGNKLYNVPLLDAEAIFTPDGKYLVVHAEDKDKALQVMIVDAETGKQQSVVNAPELSFIYTVAFDPGDKLMALYDNRGLVFLIDIQTGKTLRTLGKLGEKFNGGSLLKFNGAGTRLVLGGNGLVRLWDTQTGKPLAELSWEHEGIGYAEFGLDDKRVVFVSEDTVRLHDAETGEQLAELVVNNGAPQARFSPDGARLVVTHDDVIQVWDAQSGNKLLEWNTPDELSRWLFSPDGSILITSTMSGITQLWNPLTGEQIIELKGHHAQLWSIVFSPDRSLLATSSDDNTVRLWGLGQP